jgi:hypothetical protein
MRILASGHPPPLPGFLSSLAGPLDHFGYWAVLLFVLAEDCGIPVPGETVLNAASVYAGAGRLNVVAVGLAAADAPPRSPYHPQPPYHPRPRTGQGPALRWAALGKRHSQHSASRQPAFRSKASAPGLVAERPRSGPPGPGDGARAGGGRSTLPRSGSCSSWVPNGVAFTSLSRSFRRAGPGHTAAGQTARPHVRCRAKNRPPSSASNCGTPV